MTEYEITGLLYSVIDSMATVFTVYLTIISGYLIVAYLVGRRLMPVQAITINILFVSIMAIQIYSMFLYALEVGALLELKANVSELTLFQRLISNQLSNYATVLLMFLGVIAALFFFYSSRRNTDL